MHLSHAAAPAVKYDSTLRTSADTADNIVRFPRPWMFELNLQPRALALALAITQWTLKKGWCYYSAAELARRLGWSERTVKRGLADLRAAGILDRHRRGVRLVPPLSPPRASTVTDKKRKGDNGGPATSKEPIKILTEPKRKERAPSNTVAELNAEPDIEPLALVSSDSQDRESQNHQNQERQYVESLSDIEAKLDKRASDANAAVQHPKAGRRFEIRDALAKYTPDKLAEAVERAASSPWVIKCEGWGDIVAHVCKHAKRYIDAPGARWGRLTRSERSDRVLDEMKRKREAEFPDEPPAEETSTEEITAAEPIDETAEPPAGARLMSFAEFMKLHPETDTARLPWCSR